MTPDRIISMLDTSCRSLQFRARFWSGQGHVKEIFHVRLCLHFKCQAHTDLEVVETPTVFVLIRSKASQRTNRDTLGALGCSHVAELPSKQGGQRESRENVQVEQLRWRADCSVETFKIHWSACCTCRSSDEEHGENSAVQGIEYRG
jgi:hypothetical protein